MKIDVYTKPSCAACLFTKRYLQTQGMDFFTEIIVDKDITVAEVRERFPQALTVPIIVIDEIYIGGYPELAEFLEKRIENVDAQLSISEVEFFTELRRRKIIGVSE